MLLYPFGRPSKVPVAMLRFRLTLAVAALTACCCRTTPAAAGPTPVHGSNITDVAELDEPRRRAMSKSAIATAVFAQELSAPRSNEDLESAFKYLRPEDHETDDDQMMADMPALADDGTPQDPAAAAAELARDLEEEALKRNRENPEFTTKIAEDGYNDSSSKPDKMMMIQNIQKKIMNYVGVNGRPSLSPIPILKINSGPAPVSATQKDALRQLYENLSNFPSVPTDSFTEKTQSFYPICDVPKNTNAEVWNTKDSMNLMFNISFPKVSNGISINLSTAKLRLYKQLVSCNSATSNETTDDSPICQPILTEETINRSSATNTSSSVEVPTMMEDKQIRVSIYAHTRSLKKRKVKRKLLDSRMIPYYGEKWTEWNIRGAVKAWRRDATRNYGISIEIEDEDGNLLPVNRFFKPMNCTGDAQTTTPKPIPGFLLEAAQRRYAMPDVDANTNMSSLHSFSLNLYRYPIIDVTTVEVPDSDADNAMLSQYAKYSFEQNLAGKISQSGSQPPRQETDLAETHRIRHGNNGRQHRENSTADSE